MRDSELIRPKLQTAVTYVSTAVAQCYGVLRGLRYTGDNTQRKLKNRPTRIVTSWNTGHDKLPLESSKG